MSQRSTLDLSWNTVLRVAALVGGIWLIIQLKTVILLFLAVFLLAAAGNPVVALWQRRLNVRRSVAVGLLTAAVVVGFLAILALFVPLFARQLQELAATYPQLVAQLNEGGQLAQAAAGGLARINETLANLSGTLLQAGISALAGLAALLTAVVLASYLLLEEDNAREFFHQVLPADRYGAAYESMRKISDKVGAWLRGQLTLMLVIGVANYLLYLAIGVPSPVALSLWAAVCEAIPFIGPMIGAVPAILVSLAQGEVIDALLIFLLNFLLLQQLEAHILAPRIMQRAVGLSPVFVILALLAGFQLFGITGALLAVPAAAALAVIVADWNELSQLWRRGS